MSSVCVRDYVRDHVRVYIYVHDNVRDNVRDYVRDYVRAHVGLALLPRGTAVVAAQGRGGAVVRYMLEVRLRPSVARHRAYKH